MFIAQPWVLKMDRSRNPLVCQHRLHEELPVQAIRYPVSGRLWPPHGHTWVYMHTFMYQTCHIHTEKEKMISSRDHRIRGSLQKHFTEERQEKGSQS